MRLAALRSKPAKSGQEKRENRALRLKNAESLKDVDESGQYRPKAAISGQKKNRSRVAWRGVEGVLYCGIELEGIISGHAAHNLRIPV